MQMFFLVKRPADGPIQVRGAFTTMEKAQNFDPMLKGTWKPGVLGAMVSHPESFINKHTIHCRPVNEELQL